LVSSVKYLGLTIGAGNNFNGDWQEVRANFYKASNSILGKLGSSSSIDIALKLLLSKALPFQPMA
jgi:hypothetical protein